MKSPLFTGCGTALVTPMRGGAPEPDALDLLIELQYAGGASALIVCGTTGEAATLSPTEHEALFRRAVIRARGRMKVVAGVGSNDPKRALDMAKRAEQCGADGVLMVTPYYNKATQAGLVEHFAYVADRSALPVILYNVPSRTGVGIAPETYALLAKHPNINGAKEASGDLHAFARARALCGDGLSFWSGNDADTVAMMALGAKGVVSVASNLVPDVVSRLCRLCLDGDFAAARALNARYTELFDALFCEVNPIPVKAAMAMLGRCGPELRLPLTELTPKNAAKLRGVLKRCGLML